MLRELGFSLDQGESAHNRTQANVFRNQYARLAVNVGM